MSKLVWHGEGHVGGVGPDPRLTRGSLLGRPQRVPRCATNAISISEFIAMYVSRSNNDAFDHRLRHMCHR